MRPPLTGWMYTDATRQVACPKCGQAAGDDCRAPRGRRARVPHCDRVAALNRVAPREAHVIWPGENRDAKLAAINAEWVVLPPLPG